MKPISTAMALGRMLVRPVAGKIDDGQGGGCAWGMVHAATEDPITLRDQALKIRAALPCYCAGRIMGTDMSFYDSIYMNTLLEVSVHLFNYHVMTAKDWTFDQLLDWVRENEPDVPEVSEVQAVQEVEEEAIHK
jgi:hypothetical protein